MKEIERITFTACNRNTAVDTVYSVTAKNYSAIIKWENFMASNIIIVSCLGKTEQVDRVGRKKIRKLDTPGDIDKTLNINKAQL